MGEDDKTYSQEIQDRIRELAHSMWEWAGRQQDMALHYWVAAEKEVLATLRAAADKLMPGEKPEKAEESMAEAAEPAASEPPELAEVAVKPPGKTEAGESKAEAAKRTRGRTRT
jgi:hypothetical protein